MPVRDRVAELAEERISLTKTPDLSEFVKLSHPKKPPCRVGAVLAVLEREESERLAAACEAIDVVSPGAISEWLHQRDHQVSTSAVVSHRRGLCTCSRR